MALGTYADLLAAIPRWGMRAGDEEYEAAVPEFIQFCEDEMNARLRVGDQETSLTLPLIDGVASLPDDFLGLRVAGNGQRSTSLVSPGFATDVYGLGGSDATYTLTGNEIRSYSNGHPNVTLTYYAAIPPLGPDNPTNWLLTKAPKAYLYGSLAQGAVFSKDNEDAQKWGSLFEATLSDLRRIDQMARYGGARVRPNMITP